MKTLGIVSAELIAKLYDNNRTVFALDDVVRYAGNSRAAAAKMVFDLLKRKIIYRLKRGKYLLIPQELGSTQTFRGNWYIAAREIVNSPEYYIGFYSAMQYWGMTTHPVIKTYVATPQRQFLPCAMADKLFFVTVHKRNIWGITEAWITKTEKARFSSIEKTIIDALAHPEYCGGITEVAKGLWIAKRKVDLRLLVDYALKYGKKAVSKRLGYVLELISIGDAALNARLRVSIKDRYDLFDPTLERQSVNKNNWRLIDNVGKEQIRKIISS